MGQPKVRYLRVSWEELYGLARRVARQIVASGWRPDGLVAISRGGLFHGRVLSDLLGIPRLHAVKVEHWGVTATITGEARITAPLSAPVEGQRVLAVDDIADTGDSLALVRDHLRERGAAEVRLGTLHYLPASKVKPDHFGRTLRSWVWVVYPWNFTEDIGNVAKKLLGDGSATAEELRRRLAAGGLRVTPKEMVDALSLLEWQGKMERSGGKWEAKS